MHILYVDDSGSVENASETHFVLGAVAVFERGLYHQIKAADDCVASFNLGDAHDFELHGTDMYNGRKEWRSVSHRPSREAMIHKALGTLSGHRNVKLFAVVIDKASVSPRDAVAVAFEEMCNRFNLFLARISDRGKSNEQQKGLIVMDEMKHEKPLQMLARKFRIDGARWGHFRNLAEVPLFVDSKASRLIQMADLVSWSTFRRYEFKDGRFFDPLIRLFDADGGVVHGLFHHTRDHDSCFCPACYSRAKRSDKTA